MKVKQIIFYICLITLIVGVFAISPIKRYANAASESCYSQKIAKQIDIGKTHSCINVSNTTIKFAYNYGGSMGDTSVRTTISNTSGSDMIVTSALSLDYKTTLLSSWSNWFNYDAIDNVKGKPGYDTISAVVIRNYNSSYKYAKENMKILDGSVEGGLLWCTHSIKTNAD